MTAPETIVFPDDAGCDAYPDPPPTPEEDAYVEWMDAQPEGQPDVEEAGR